MPFREELNKYLKNTIYKHSLVSKPVKNNYYILYSYTLASIKRDDGSKPITTPKTIKDI